MLQKIAPLIILAMFAVGAYFMVQGMHSATQLAKPKSKSSEDKKTTVLPSP
ncbi:MAG: hypothetical protein LGB07_06735 [Sulfurovum sp.]|nr:hypothetical protein [Sulfurovum sp.]MCB4745327.1 hypothetical protein [Sulfurovum sp.]MCB4747290.1 hypothetical protein [Sulfurovum sp.]MCB4752548.1 hypothetical protein [Sulfurovum sp.]MCB4755138.1 hypothetical protein [Sulfurovum sp.]